MTYSPDQITRAALAADQIAREYWSNLAGMIVPGASDRLITRVLDEHEIEGEELRNVVVFQVFAIVEAQLLALAHQGTVQ